MNTPSTSVAPHHAASATITPLLRTVLLCDLVESTALVERLGDSRVAVLLQRHDQLLARLLARSQGQLIDKADGILALFERPVQALEFAIHYQRGLRELGRDASETLQARIGIHVGDVMTWTHTPAEVLAGAKPVEVEGLAKPVAARLMGLALPGQILLSGMAQNLAQRAQDELGEDAAHLRWLQHGRYRFKGVPAPMLVHEVGEAGLAPLKPPPSGAKAWRELPLWRKPPVLALELLLLSGLVVGGIWSVLRRPPAIAFAERDWVVVADFNNRTGETLYDDALDSALRIGLEQSRYVNVLSDLQVDQALQRMQRGGKTIDRQIGSELALREGAKALVLPTVADVGGRPRVSVEVVDPNSGVTVYTRMADASGEGGVVAALDDVLSGMRADLGESLASIEESSVPLEQATTSDLEALRAFSLGVQARLDGKTTEAVDLFQQAVRRDPGFAMAYLRLAFTYQSEDNDEAQRYFDLADSKRDRLSQRETLLLDASLAAFGPPEQMLRKWEILASMYPDEHRAYYNFSYFARNDMQWYGKALSYLEPALAASSPLRGAAYYLQGAIFLSMDKTNESLESFRRAESLGVGGYVRDHADAYAVSRDFKAARSLLAKHVSEGVSGVLFEETLPRVTYAIDEGDWSRAISEARAIEKHFEGSSSTQRGMARLLLLSLLSYDSNPINVAELRAFVGEQTRMLHEANQLDKRFIAFNLLGAGWIAAKAGEQSLGKEALAAAESSLIALKFVANEDMARVVRAQLLLGADDAEAAVELLMPRSRTGDESYFLHSVLMRAYAKQANFVDAFAQADWLAKNRGRAYSEYNSNWVWQPVNVLESNLAILCSAVFAEALGKAEVARTSRESIAQAWPKGDHLPMVAKVPQYDCRSN